MESTTGKTLSMTKEEWEDRVVKFASRCVKVCVALPQDKIGGSCLSDQLFRAAASVAANYAEGAEAESRKDFIHKLKLSMKELSESRIWLKIIGEIEYVPKSKLASLIAESRELSRMLAAGVTTARKNED